MGPMGNVDTGGNGVQGIWGISAMRPTGSMESRCMGHMGINCTGGMGYKGYGSHGQWGTWAMGPMGNGAPWAHG